MKYVIDSSDDSEFSDLFESAIEYADDDVDLLQLAMVLLEQMDLDAFVAEPRHFDLETECAISMLPMLAYSA